MEFHEETDLLSRRLDFASNTVYNDFLNHIHKFTNQEADKKIFIIIDGMSGGGKTYLGKHLQHIFNSSLFSMDDFFLQKNQRTAERLDEAGGNIDYKRFGREVLEKLIDASSYFSLTSTFTYQKFNCSTMELGELINAYVEKINIIEGSYSLHPYFKPYYEKLEKNGIVIKTAVRISSEEQRKRILHRNGELMLNRFINEWIPMENKYFKAYDIYNSCDFVFDQ